MISRKPLLLALAASIGGLAVILWPLLARHLPLLNNQADGPPLVSVQQAQRQVAYPLWVPQEVPGGGMFIGAVVYRVKTPGLAQARAEAETQRSYASGYGLQFLAPYGTLMVCGEPGSPAERAGLERSSVLLAVNGHSIAGKTRVAVKESALHSPPPLSLTYRATDGSVHRVLLRPERYITHPGVPYVYAGKLAALDFHVRGRSITLQEWPAGEGPPPRRNYVRRVSAGGATVLLADTDRGSCAYWTRGPTRFILEDTGGVLSQAEVIRFIQSLALPRYQARR